MSKSKPISKKEAEKLAQVERFFTIIETHRLLFNTLDELKQYAEYSNSLKKKGGDYFTKEAILQKLVQDARKCADGNLNLIDVIETYKEATELLDLIKPRHRKLMTCYKLITYFYANGKSDIEITEILNRAKVKHVPFLVLMMLGALPLFDHARGDVKDIKKHYDNVFNLLDIVISGKLLTKKMVLKEAIKEDVEDDPKLMTRWHLIYTISTILEEFGKLCSPENRADLLKKTYTMAYYPTYIETYWADSKFEDIFWYFERVGDDYLLYRFKFNKEAHQINYIRFELLFCSEEDSSVIMAILTHPKATRKSLESSPLSEKYYAYLGVEETNGDLIFEPWFPKDIQWHSLEHLTRSESVKDRIEEFEKCVNDESFELINEFEEEEYELSAPMAAITCDFIYLKIDDGKYLKIPKSLDSALDSISFNHSVFIISFHDAQWIYFKDFGLSYNVTTPDLMGSHGIEAVDGITTNAN